MLESDGALRKVLTTDDSFVTIHSHSAARRYGQAECQQLGVWIRDCNLQSALQGTLAERAESLVVGVPRSDDAQPERALEAIEHSISVPVFKVDCHPLPPTSFKKETHNENRI